MEKCKREFHWKAFITYAIAILGIVSLYFTTIQYHELYFSVGTFANRHVYIVIVLGIASFSYFFNKSIVRFIGIISIISIYSLLFYRVFTLMAKYLYAFQLLQYAQIIFAIGAFIYFMIATYLQCTNTTKVYKLKK